jgi:hypothetical protein
MWGGLFIATACVVSVQLVNFGAEVKISGRWRWAQAVMEILDL